MPRVCNLTATPGLAADAGTSALAPARVSYSARVASSSSGAGLTPTASGPTLAALTSEDGVTLSVGLAAVPTPQESGQIHSNAVTYSGAAESSGGSPTTSDLSLQATASGLDARVVLHSASETGPFVVTLGVTSSVQVTQDTSGTIEVTQPITDYGDDGVMSTTITQPEYTIGTPLLTDASTAITAPVSTGPATATLTTGAGGPAVSLSVDPTWLNDPTRVFPATLDLPLVTAASGINAGLLGTVSSCAPTMPAPLTRVVVGTATGCAYHGLTTFDLTQLPSDAAIVSATLRLYTPDQMTATGVQVYPNAPVSDPSQFDPSAPPSWASAPAISGTTGIAQSGSDGHWQSWDVTSLVQGWAQDSSTNGGVTLESGGAPVRFASPLGAGTDSPSVAPYLDIVYAPAAKAPTPPYNDGARSIYGVSGSFTVKDPNPKNNLPSFNALNPQCSSGNPTCGGNTRITTVRNNLGGSFMRVAVQVDCDNSAPGLSWWGAQSTESLSGNDGAIIDLMATAYNNGVIPIVNFTVPNNNANCHAKYSPASNGYSSNWASQMQNFVSTIKGNLPSPWKNNSLPFTYFEIGNEQNINDIAYYGPTGNYYPLLFQAAASGLYGALGKGAYRVITDGMVRPATTDARNPVGPNQTGKYVCGETNGPAAGQTTNHLVAVAAINDALQGNSAQNEPAVPYTQLGLGVHPYHYTTANTYYWRNYYSEYGYANPLPGSQALHNGWPGACGDLGAMIRLWTNPAPFAGKHRLPVVFTEDDWSAQPFTGAYPVNHQYCSNPTGCEGAYLVDLFTWLWDTHAAASGASGTAGKQLRVMWYRGADKANAALPTGADILGLYDNNPKGKTFHLHDCATGNGVRALDNEYTDYAGAPIIPSGAPHDLPTYYKLLLYGACYGPQ